MRQRYESLREDDGVFTGLLRLRSLQRPSPTADDAVLNLDRQIPIAVDTVARSLTHWSALAQHIGAALTYVLQPRPNWVSADP
ncbi:hypothetical protein ACWKWA_15520, partial [Dermacoccus abyssi]